MTLCYNNCYADFYLCTNEGSMAHWVCALEFQKFLQSMQFDCSNRTTAGHFFFFININTVFTGVLLE